MSSREWGALRPEDVSQWITFERGNADWRYESANKTSMAAKQAEGVAGLWNRLAQYDLALLADEVGMGKTMQALGVMALLWKQNPDAKVLVMAPNRDICTHWIREYRGFLREHYKEVDHLVRNLADGGPVHEPQLCKRLPDLQEAVSSGAGHFYLTTIHSLSGLLPSDLKVSDDKQRLAERTAREINREILRALDGAGFDLVIIDEAHYFRKAGGGSQRVGAARGFFGSGNKRLAERALLLTATPSHSSLADVPAIFSYFTDFDRDVDLQDAPELLRKHAVRRLRMMEGAADDSGQRRFHNKYSYRHERALPADFGDDLSAELFFALYQKKLVEDAAVSGNNRRFMYGYLEGFESVGVTDPTDNQDSENNDDQVAADSYTTAPDTQVLQALTREYHRRFSRYPAHPKYDKLLQQCVPQEIFSTGPDLHEHKHLIFVRRIPSVREITQRVNEAYDELLANRIVKALGVPRPATVLKDWRAKGWSRRFFTEFVAPTGKLTAEEREQLSAEDEDLLEQGVTDEEKLSSRIADLFVVKRGRFARTDATNVRLRFRKPESLFSLFMEPASDYFNGEYTAFRRKQVGERTRDSFSDVALATRLQLHDRLTSDSEAEHVAGADTQRYESPLPTAWGMMFDLLPEAEQALLRQWRAQDLGILENLGNYLKTGFLYASPVMVELYCWFTQFNRKKSSGNAQTSYRAFIQHVRRELPSSLMFQYFVNAIRTFEPLCEKITDHRLADWEKPWAELTSLQNPAWFASGETSNRQRLILGFNSPFYPNVLVATSVFQEGVNLHLQCRKVHHYGIAWTPGDNEQRVGRVDRLFGCVNNRLQQQENTELAIHYPYLNRSFDQEQVASFIRMKHDVEGKMDACRHHDTDRQIDLANAVEGWEDFLRRPDQSNTVADPYPADLDPAQCPAFDYQPVQSASSEELTNYLRGQLHEISRLHGHDFYRLEHSEQHPAAQFLLEATLPQSQRRQPIVAELRYSSELSSLVSGTVYYLSLISPLATRAALNANHQEGLTRATRRFKAQREEFPLVKLALDKDKANSHFYLTARVDLPLFALGDGHKMLSGQEIEQAYRQLYEFADRMEIRLFAHEQDLQKDDLEIELSQDNDEAPSVEDESIPTVRLRRGWRREKTPHGPVVLTEVYLTRSEFSAVRALRFDGRDSVPDKLAMLSLNNGVPLLQFYPSGNHRAVQLAFPHGDIQEGELQLLTRWLEHVSSNVATRSTSVVLEPV
ncbi:ATP-dependent helicase HepA [Microbulbifer aggregans]|uniref:ATP-dependent helicase HepA n=1 Tax=Microbulbifer aggregans TaxID=1769779 RepID=A0A1C9W4S0_9GAMM|nr:DEAD/DEAH box helicase [Microbulbifer aggregans]AOS96147.1 ATP-dependent helicase HepA [Microbulbifer aggregans]